MNVLRTAFAAALMTISASALSAQEMAETDSETVSFANVELDPEAVAIATEIIDLAYPLETRSAMFNGVSETIFEQMRESMKLLPDDPEKQALLNDFQRRMLDNSKPIMDRHIPMLMDGWAKAYANIFTKSELGDILTFVKTETGQKMFSKSLDVLSDPYYSEPMQAYFAEIGDLQREEVKRFVAEMTALEIEELVDSEGQPAVDKEEV